MPWLFADCESSKDNDLYASIVFRLCLYLYVNVFVYIEGLNQELNNDLSNGASYRSNHVSCCSISKLII